MPEHNSADLHHHTCRMCSSVLHVETNADIVCLLPGFEHIFRPVLHAAMSQRMDARLQALCYFYRHPPAGSGVKPQPYSEIAKLVKRPHMPVGTIRQSVRRFMASRKVRGRKSGWRKTTPAEDTKLIAAFRKVRKPLGSLVD